jgi:hypothetical protein
MRVTHLRPGRALSLLAARPALLALALSSLLVAPGLVIAQGAQEAQTPKPAAPPATVPPASLPTARAIIDRYIEAVGGRKAILAHSSSRASGTMTVPSSGISGTLEVYGAKPNKSLVKITMGGIGEITEAFDGKIGWSLNPMTGPRLTEGKELEEKAFDADFYSDLHEPGRYVSMTTVGQVEFDGRQCYKVSLIRKTGGEDLEFYDVKTSLKAGVIGTRESQMGPINVTQFQSDYKKYGGLLVPTTMKQSAMGVQHTITLTAVEFDTVDPAVFTPPAPIKALIK